MDYIQPLVELTGLRAEILIGMLATGMLTTCFFAYALMTDSGAKTVQIAQVSTDDGSGAAKRVKVPRDQIVIVGPSDSGKTYLYYTLVGGSKKDTLCSQEINRNMQATVKVPNRLLGPTPSGEEGTSMFTEVELKLVDIPGHYNFRRDVMDSARGAKAIVLMLDSRKRETFGEAAEILYDLLNDVDIIDDEVSILVVCNKQDLPFARKALQVERDFQQEIEQIRKVKKAQR